MSLSRGKESAHKHPNDSTNKPGGSQNTSEATGTTLLLARHQAAGDQPQIGGPAEPLWTGPKHQGRSVCSK
ncbi:hypothetical protein DPEC_G00252050 [Dallia pectoralis]|uniref:Uncharacterized protein n=1 Tax=Dallia pectoralis TaxID=75939 RepID=A0ACC2FTX6_DALPE|nr:hypothetical protein DPEC_G00252050 [Dallia pectoralis]